MVTKTISSTKFRDNQSDVMKEIEKNKDFFIITKQGSPKSIIADIDFFEDLLSVANKKYVKSIKEAREDYNKKDVFTHDEVFGEL